MLKVFEYAYTTKHMGIIYSRGLDPHGDNNLYLYADSAHDIPRSYGCTVAMMNGGAMSLSAKKHTLTASATNHDELIEFSIAQVELWGSGMSWWKWDLSRRMQRSSTKTMKLQFKLH
jgi:hypothetical protein